MAFVTLREGETSEQLLRRFLKEVTNGGILREVKQRRFFRSKGEEQRLERQRGIRRMRKAEARRAAAK